MGRNRHVTPCKDDGWQVKGENNKKANVRTGTQAKAIERTGKIVCNQQVGAYYTRQNGTIHGAIFMETIRSRQEGNKRVS